MLSSPLLWRLHSDALVALARFAKLRELPTGGAVFRRGYLPQALHFVVVGEVEVKDADRHITRHGPGELVGSMSSMSIDRYASEARAAGPSRVLALRLGDLRSVMDADPDVRRAFLRACDGLRRPAVERR